MKPLTKTFHIAGVAYRDLTGFPVSLPANSPATLVHDTFNTHDPLAVKVEIADYWIGYIPRQELAHLHLAAQQGVPVRCEVTFFPSKPPYEQFSARLYIPHDADVVYHKSTFKSF